MTALRSRLFAIFLLASFALFVGAGAACSGGGGTPTPVLVPLSSPVANPTATPEAVTTSADGEITRVEVNLALNGSPQQGTAVFTRRGEITHVEIRLQPGFPVQGVALKRGVCPNPERFRETLDPVIGGVMRQELRGVPFDDVLSGGLAIVVSTGRNTFNTFAACAELPALK